MVLSACSALALVLPATAAAQRPAVSISTSPAIPIEGHSFDLEAGGAGTLSYKWDLDGDGNYDDALGDLKETWPAGTRTVSVSGPGLPTHVFSTRIFVASTAPDRTPRFSALGLDRLGAPGEPIDLDFWGDADAERTFDLDGDGAFDDTPVQYRVPGWTFWAPVTIASKLTDRQTGATVVQTAQVLPQGSDAAPAIDVRLDGPTAVPTSASLVIIKPASPVCCKTEWDLDGVGVYGDGPGTTAAIPTSQGYHTIAVRVTDGEGQRSFVRKRYYSYGAPPVPSPTPTPPAPPAAPKPLKVSMQVSTAKLAWVLAHGLRVRPRCDATCRATVTVSRSGGKQLGKATSKNKTITVKLTSKAKRSLRHATAVKLRIVVVATTADGRRVKSTKTLRITR